MEMLHPLLRIGRTSHSTQRRHSLLACSHTSFLCIMAVGCASTSQDASIHPPQAEVSAPAQSTATWHVQPDAAPSAGAKIAPPVSFSFLPPHDTYAGDFAAATGWLNLRCDAAPCGEFRVNIADLDMGDPDLTKNVQSAVEMLHGEKHPRATFTVREIHPQAELMRFLSGSYPAKTGDKRDDPVAKEIDAVLSGEFQLKGVTTPLVVPVRLTAAPELRPGSPAAEQPLSNRSPVAPSPLDAATTPDDASGRPALLLTATFTLDQLASRYSLAVPEPGDPASDRVTINVQLRLSPAK